MCDDIKKLGQLVAIIQFCYAVVTTNKLDPLIQCTVKDGQVVYLISNWMAFRLKMTKKCSPTFKKNLQHVHKLTTYFGDASPVIASTQIQNNKTWELKLVQTPVEQVLKGKQVITGVTFVHEKRI